MTESTIATFSVDTTLRIERVRRIIPIVRIGKVVVPVNVDLVGTTTFPILTIGIILLTLSILRVVSTEKVKSALLVFETEDALS
jgi:hypothetical protein